ncbi:hypothetical protein L6R53_27235 [Myxococcota bacterium]|nr:hypothetical protein [Myxococcota bacterium]
MAGGGVAARLWMLSLPLWACRPAPPADARRYVDAAASGRGEDCAALADPALADECRTFAAWARVDAGDEAGARAACADLAPGPWRDECHFGLADRLDAWGEPLRALCGQAGAFRDACLSHALGRRAQAVLGASPLGDEAAAFAQVEALAVEVYGPSRGPGRARALTRKALASRLDGGELRREHCGAAPPELCAEAYGVVLLAAAGSRAALATSCPDGGDPLALRARGWPAWSPDAEEIARQGWRQLCAPPPRPPAGPPSRPTPPR